MKLEQWVAGEITLTAQNTYKNPFIDVDVTAEFTAPSGRTLRLLAFWDGGQTFKVRFAPTETGVWTYTVFSTSADPGLSGVTGTVECVPYTGALELYQHGFLKVGPKGRYLTYDDGTPFFWLADTHWTFTSTPASTKRTAASLLWKARPYTRASRATSPWAPGS